MALPIESPNRYKAMKPFSVAVVGIVVGCSAVRPKSTPKEVRSFLFCLRFQSAGAFSSLTSSPFFFYRSVGVGSGFWANLSEYFCCRRYIPASACIGQTKFVWLRKSIQTLLVVNVCTGNTILHYPFIHFNVLL